jgi:hypothetical protein
MVLPLTSTAVESLVGSGQVISALSGSMIAAAAALGEDPADAVRAALAQARADLDAVPAGGDPLVRTALGGMRLSAYLSTRTIELVIHGGDLSRAVGVPFHAPEEALTEVASVLAAVAVRRGLAPTLLAAMTGRETLPEGFTVL